MPAADPVSIAPSPRIVVFVDYWNFQLSINEIEVRSKGIPDSRFHVDWLKLGPYLAQCAFDLMTPKPANFSFDGMNIYAPYNPQTEEGRKFKKWATGWLGIYQRGCVARSNQASTLIQVIPEVS